MLKPGESMTVRNWKLSRPVGRDRTIYLDGPNWSDSGILYDDGRMAFDFPERIPDYVKKAARKAMRPDSGGGRRGGKRKSSARSTKRRAMTRLRHAGTAKKRGYGVMRRATGSRSMPDNTYEVVVGNIGTVYSGPSNDLAIRTFHDYVRQSNDQTGRAAGEDVTYFKNGEILSEHRGALND